MRLSQRKQAVCALTMICTTWAGVRVNHVMPQLVPLLGGQSLELSTYEQHPLFTNTGQIKKNFSSKKKSDFKVRGT
jgi:hypothetical protein